MKFKNIKTGAILEPNTEFAKKQMAGSDLYVEVKTDTKSNKKADTKSTEE